MNWLRNWALSVFFFCFCFSFSHWYPSFFRVFQSMPLRGNNLLMFAYVMILRSYIYSVKANHTCYTISINYAFQMHFFFHSCFILILCSHIKIASVRAKWIWLCAIGYRRHTNHHVVRTVRLNTCTQKSFTGTLII